LSEKDKYENVESIIQEIHGPEFRNKFGYNTDPLFFTKEFHVMVQLKVGAQDINNDKVSSALILNESMAVIDNSQYD
jgi:hypothetical protein